MLRFKKQKIARAVKGFRLPTLEYEEDMLDITERIVVDADNTYYIQMDSDTMVTYGIYKGSVLVIDKTLTACNGAIVVAFLNGDWLVREYTKHEKIVTLKASDAHATITVNPADTLTVWGVVTVTISPALPPALLKGKYRDVCAC